MTNSRPIFRIVVVCAIATLTLSACVVAPHPRTVYVQPVAVQPEIVVGVAPPPPYVEIIPVVPFAGAVWIGGYWGWSGGRHQWYQGATTTHGPVIAGKPTSGARACTATGTCEAAAGFDKR